MNYYSRFSFLILLCLLLGALPVANTEAESQGQNNLYLPFARGGSGNVQPTNPPVINSFTATPPSIVQGGSSTLAWNVTNATSLSISPTVGPVSGSSVAVNPQQTTTYTLTATNADGSTTAQTTVTVTQAPPSEGGALFLSQDQETNSADVKVDSAGGMHLSYAAYVPYGQPSPAYYAYCGAGDETCDDRSNWTVAALGNRVDEVQLQLSPAGKPRLLMATSDNEFHYAECDSGCGTTANWDIAVLGRTDYTDFDMFSYGQNYFALDNSGRPRFTYHNNWGELSGTWYVYCNQACTNPDNWSETRISEIDEWRYTELFENPSLTFTSTGQPRLFTNSFSELDHIPSGLYYFECNSGCEDGANWERVLLPYARGQTHVTWSLQLDASNRPRVAFYQGVLDGSTAGERLHYLSCQSGCLDAANWTDTVIGVEQGNGADADLALDSQGRPRIAYSSDDPGGLGYAWCDTTCTSPAQWQHTVAEPVETLDEEFPIPPPAHCSLSFWYGSFRPALALDAEGNPRVAYDAEHMHGGGCTPDDDFRAVRFIFFPQP